MPIRAVSFDIDDTLHDFHTASCHALERVMERLRCEIGPAAAALRLEDVIADLTAVAEEMEHPYADLHGLRTRSFLRTLGRFGRTDRAAAESLSLLYLRHRFDRVELFDGVPDVLRALRRKYRVCAVSNGEQDLAQLGLDGAFDVVVFAADVGFDKPDARIFRAAMDRAHCAPEAFVHVGDSPEHDVAGVQAAGGRGVWFNRASAPLPESSRPDAVVRSLRDVPAVLERMG